MLTETLTPDVARRLPGPGWLVERRTRSAEAAATAAMPSTEAEEWRYSRVGELDLTRFSPAGSGDSMSVGPEVPAQVRELVEQLGDLAGFVILVDGRVAELHVGAETSELGVTFGPLADQSEDLGLLGVAATEPHDLFALYNDAFGAEPIGVDVPRNVELRAPIAVVSYLTRAGSAVFPRLAVRAGENSECSVIEVALSDDVEALTAPVTEIEVGPAARVHYVAIQDLGRSVWQLGSFVASIAQDATLSAAAAAIGGRYARLRLDCRLEGRGATGNLSSVYFGDGNQMLDLRTFQEHRAPDTTSRLLFKGAVSGHSHSVYTGLIRIGPEGRGTNAFQTNRNLKLSEHAWAESVPNLEIENNDVRCSHASTVGPIDEDQRFYLESRGVPPTATERLIVDGFFDEVVDDLPVPSAAPVIRGRLAGLLDRAVGTVTTEVPV